MNRELGPTELELNGEVVSINDDPALYGHLSVNVLSSIERIPAQARKDAFIDKVIEIRMAALKLGFLIQRAKASDSPGIGLSTLDDFHTHLLRIGSLDASLRPPAPPQLILPDDLPLDVPNDEL